MMDIDVDLDHELCNKLNSMGTRDHEDLISQFQSIVGTQISPGGCSFYLEMASWNLQAALCAYYDIMSTNETIPEMTLVEDVTMRMGETVLPGTPQVKTWRIKNSGRERWGNGLRLKYVRGCKFGDLDSAPVPAINPEECTDVSLHFEAPVVPGDYESQWRLLTRTGAFCGDTLTIALRVEETCVMSLTEQMSHLGRPEDRLGEMPPPPMHLAARAEPMTAPTRAPVAPTPFCSPTGYGIFGGSPAAIYSRPNTLPTIDESALSSQLRNQATLFELNQSDRCNGYQDNSNS